MGQHLLYLHKFDVDFKGCFRHFEPQNGFTSAQLMLRDLGLYCLMADGVYLPPSAALKNSSAFLALSQLRDAMLRSSEQDSSKPVIDMSIHGGYDSFTHYLSGREKSLSNESLKNPEKLAYQQSGAREIARFLDVLELPRSNSVKGHVSVNTNLRALASKYFEGDFSISAGLSEKQRIEAIKIIEGSEFFQTYWLIDKIGLNNPRTSEAIYECLRAFYFSVNAQAIGATCLASSSVAVVYREDNMWRFLNAVGLGALFARTEFLTGPMLHRLRLSASFRRLRTEYFACQTQQEILTFIQALKSAQSKRLYELLSPYSVPLIVGSASYLVTQSAEDMLLAAGAAKGGELIVQKALDRWFNHSKRNAMKDNLSELRSDVKGYLKATSIEITKSN